MPRLRVNYKFSVLYTKHPFFSPVDSCTSAVITTDSTADSTAAQLTLLDPTEKEKEKEREEGEEDSKNIILNVGAEESDEVCSTHNSFPDCSN